MEDPDEELLEVKREVRSLLISTTTAATIHSLLRDYRESMGKELPFRRFGYRTPLDFLNTMPDVVNIKHVLGQVALTPVEVSESSHVNQLVMHQRGTNRRTRGGESALRRRRGVVAETPPSLWRPSPLMPFVPPYPFYGAQATPRFSHCSNDFIPTWLSMPRPLAPRASLNDSSWTPMEKENNSEVHPVREDTLDSPSLAMNGDVDFVTDQNKGAEGCANIMAKGGPARAPPQPPPATQQVHCADSVESPPPTEKCRGNDTITPFLSPITERLIENLREVLKDHPSGIPLSKFPQKYLEKHSVPFSSQDYGFSSLKEFVLALQKDVFDYKKFKSNDWLLFSKISTDMIGRKTEKCIPTNVLKNMVKLVSKFPNGVYGDKVLDLYNKRYKNRLDMKELGFESVSSFLVFCQGVNCRQVGDNMVVFPKKKFADEEETSDKPPAVPPVIELAHMWSKFIPEDVCWVEDRFNPFVVPPGPFDYLKVQVVDMDDPHSIWLQLLDKHYEIANLMDDLNIFYDLEGTNYVMENHIATVGQMCSVRFSGDNRWHRAKVIGVKGESVELSYVDYGTKDVVNAGELRFLHKKFSKLPIQAIRGKMAELTWPETQIGWPSDTNCYLSQLTFNKPLVAEVVKIHFKEPYMDVVLFDTSGTQDLNVNVTLLDKGYAVRCMVVLPSSEDESSSNESSGDVKDQDGRVTHTVVESTTGGEELEEKDEFEEEEELDEEEEDEVTENDAEEVEESNEIKTEIQESEEDLSSDGTVTLEECQPGDDLSANKQFSMPDVASKNFYLMESRLKCDDELKWAFSPQGSNLLGRRLTSANTISTMTSLPLMVDESCQTDLALQLCSMCRNQLFNMQVVNPLDVCGNGGGPWCQYCPNEIPYFNQGRYYDQRRVPPQGIGIYQPGMTNYFGQQAMYYCGNNATVPHVRPQSPAQIQDLSQQVMSMSGGFNHPGYGLEGQPLYSGMQQHMPLPPMQHVPPLHPYQVPHHHHHHHHPAMARGHFHHHHHHLRPPVPPPPGFPCQSPPAAFTGLGSYFKKPLGAFDLPYLAEPKMGNIGPSPPSFGVPDRWTRPKESCLLKATDVDTEHSATTSENMAGSATTSDAVDVTVEEVHGSTICCRSSSTQSEVEGIVATPPSSPGTSSEFMGFGRISPMYTDHRANLSREVSPIQTNQEMMDSDMNVAEFNSKMGVDISKTTLDKMVGRLVSDIGITQDATVDKSNSHNIAIDNTCMMESDHISHTDVQNETESENIATCHKPENLSTHLSVETLAAQIQDEWS